MYKKFKKSDVSLEIKELLNTNAFSKYDRLLQREISI